MSLFECCVNVECVLMCLLFELVSGDALNVDCVLMCLLYELVRVLFLTLTLL